MKINNKGILVIFLISIFLLKFPTLNLPYHWDEFNNVIPAALYSYNHHFTPFLWEEGSFGHPPFLYWILALGYYIFGHSQIISHAIIVFFSFLAVYFTFLVGKELFNKKTGLIAALLLLFMSLFFAQSGIAHLAIPSAALVMITLYFAIKKRLFLYNLFGSFLVLTEERGVLLIPAILLAYFINRKKFDNRIFLYSIPLGVFFIWTVLTKLYYGWFLYPRHIDLIITNPIYLFMNIMYVLKVIFFDDFRWILTSIIILSGFSFIRFKRKLIYKKIILYFLISLIFFVILYNSINLSTYFILKYPNNLIYLNILKRFSPLFGFLFFILLCSWKEFLNFNFTKKSIIINLGLLFLICGYALLFFNHRYGVPTLPLFAILAARSLSHIFKKKTYLFLIIILFLFVMSWFGERENVGYILEDNMEYVDFIKINQEAASFLEENYKDEVILTSTPISLSLKYPYGGYVNEGLNVKAINPCPLSPIENGTINRGEINLNEIDIVVYSKQAYPSKPIDDAFKILNLEPIKKFEKNNKSIEIYEVKK